MTSDATNPSPNKRRRTDWKLIDILLECGLRSNAFELNNINAFIRKHKLGFALEENSSPSSLGHSVSALLIELMAEDIEEDEVIDKMQEELTKLLFSSRSVLFASLLPLHCCSNSDNENDGDNDENNKNDNNKIYDNTSLVKVFMRVDCLQTPLLLLLLQKLPELIAGEEEEGLFEEEQGSDDDDLMDFLDLRQFTRMILSHIRWMDHVILKPASVIEMALQCLTLIVQQQQEAGDGCGGSGNERTLLLDFIALLPDIVGNCSTELTSSDELDADDEKQLEGGEGGITNILEMVVMALRELRSDDPTLLIPCLDALSNLQLSPEQMEETVRDALAALKSADYASLPSIVRFLVQHVPLSSGSNANGTLCSEAIEEFRMIRLGENLHDSSSKPQKIDMKASGLEASSEALMLEAFAQGMQYRKDLADALLSAVQKSSDNGSADIWLLLCCGCAPHNRSKVRALFRSKSTSGHFNSSLMKDVICGNSPSLSFLFNSSMSIFDALLRCPERKARNFGGLAYMLYFAEFHHPVQRQEIIGALVTHIGSGSTTEISTAIEVLSSLTYETIQRTGGTESLRPYAPFFTSLLDFIPQLSIDQVRKLFLILFAVGEDSCADVGYDDVHIVIRKYLSQNSITAKRVGIIGSVSYVVSKSIKYSKSSHDKTSLAEYPIRRNELQDIEEETCLDITSPTSEAVKEMIDALKLAQKCCQPKNMILSSFGHGVAAAHGSPLAFFFDELSYAVRGGSLIPQLRSWIFDSFSQLLEVDFMGEFKDDSTEVVKDDHATLLDGTLIDRKTPKGELRYDIDNGEAAIYVQILPQIVSNDTTQKCMPQYLCSLLFLLASCNDRRFNGDGIEEIDAILGCPIFLPAKEMLGIEFEDLPSSKQLAVVNSLFHGACWFRELINTFIVAAASTGSDADELRSKVVERLKNLIVLEEEFLFTAKKCHAFAPPGMSILKQPRELQQATAMEQVLKNEQNRTSIQDENSIQNNMAPSEPKRMAKSEAKREKIKMKLMKLRKNYEDALSQRAQSALRKLSHESVLALGFSELKVMPQQKAESEILSVGISQLNMSDIGGPVVCLLLETLLHTLRGTLERNVDRDKSTSFSALKQSQSSSSDIMGTAQILALGKNPYALSDSSVIGQNIDNYSSTIIKQYIDGGVFSAVFEHLAAFAEIGSSNDESIDVDVRASHRVCLFLLFDCIKAIMISGQNMDDSVFYAILKQLSEGDIEAPRVGSTEVLEVSKIIKATDNLFDLVQEIVLMEIMAVDLEFNIKGMTCLEEILSCAQRYDKHNKIVVDIHKKISDLSHKLLRRRWNATFTKANVGLLLNLYVNSSFVPYFVPGPSSEINNVLEMGHNNAIMHLVKDAICELEHTPQCKGPVKSFPTLNYRSFPLFLAVVLNKLQTEVQIVFESDLAQKGAASQNLIFAILSSFVSNLFDLFKLFRDNSTLVKSKLLAIMLKAGANFVQAFTRNAVPYFQLHFAGNEKVVTGIIEMMQKSTRCMSTIIAHGRRTKDPLIMKESPKAKKAQEFFIHKIKAMMKKNNCLTAMWSGKLKEKNIDGTVYQAVVEEDSSEEEEEEVLSAEKKYENEEQETIDLVET